MSQANWEIEHYEKSSGRCPIEEFLGSLSADELVRVNRAIERLETHGLKLDYPHTEFLRDDIHALRIRIRRVRYRLFYFIYARNQFVLTHGIKKKTDKIPDYEIDKAIEYRKDYLAQVSGR